MSIQSIVSSSHIHLADQKCRTVTKISQDSLIMEILQRTNDRFREGVPVQVMRMESITTMWVRIVGFPKITQTLYSEMTNRDMEYLPKKKSLKTGMLVAVLAEFGGRAIWERALLLQRTMEGYIVLLIDWGLEIEQPLDTIRLLPRNLAQMAPWARRIVLRGVREQPVQGRQHRVAQFSMLRRTGTLVDVDPSPGEAITARLVLDAEPGEIQGDMGAFWLKKGYLDPQ
ncbi:uncharacterized protein LOC132909115 [Bombus pascuorum]|uniref:uncharacterized protein LOC132909115 n=1 Tax=Bombus pascuorum TaxID=65598 RepID=UPI00298E7F0F|nr:uncharacterized protein LOC132909115 [Bombus pascuorum]